MKKIFFITFSILLTVLMTSAISHFNGDLYEGEMDNDYEQFKGVPDDLDQHGIVFLNLDSAEVSAERPQIRSERGAWHLQNVHNYNVPKANQQLALTAPSYPCKYLITRRNKLKNYTHSDYKYVLDYAPFVKAQNGDRETNGNYTVKFPVYIENRETGDIYILGYVADNYVYRYKSILKKYLFKAVKRKFKKK